MNENYNERNNESIFSQRLKAGKRRTYFFDVRATRGNDYFITLTESKKRFNDGGYDRHKIFIYKEDFNKFLKALTETIDHVKTELMPDYDFDSFNHEYSDQDESNDFQAPSNHDVVQTNSQIPNSTFDLDLGSAEVDKW